jgi:hypothetical protein
MIVGNLVNIKIKMWKWEDMIGSYTTTQSYYDSDVEDMTGSYTTTQSYYDSDVVKLPCKTNV